MLAVQYNENSDDLSGIKLTQVEKPTATAGHVVVKVHAAAINPIDTMVAKGFAKNVLHWTMPFPFTMGYDFAGVVDSVHEGDAFVVGERVFGVNWGNHSHNDVGTPAGGAFAEYILIPASKLSKLPDAVSFEQGAAVALVGTTAYQILFDCAKVAAGSRVLILGGSTSVGSIAIQLAKARGAWVATTSSTRNLKFVTQFGADLVVNYNEQKWEDHPELKGLDAVIDAVGEKEGFSRTTSNGVVKADGAFVTITSPDVGFDPAGHPPLSFAALYCLKNSVAHQDELAAAVAAGTLNVAINEVFPFTNDGVAALIQRIDGGTSTGKNILKVI